MISNLCNSVCKHLHTQNTDFGFQMQGVPELFGSKLFAKRNSLCFRGPPCPAKSPLFSSVMNAFSGVEELESPLSCSIFIGLSHLSGQKDIHHFVIKFTMSTGLYLQRILQEESKALFRLSDYPELFIVTSIDTYKTTFLHSWKQNAAICIFLWKLLHIFL